MTLEWSGIMPLTMPRVMCESHRRVDAWGRKRGLTEGQHLPRVTPFGMRANVWRSWLPP